jgi:pilus assembly protein CpaF
VRQQISSAINLVVQTARVSGGRRKLVYVSEITGMEGDQIQMHNIFTFEQTGVDSNGNAEGFFKCHGIRPRVCDRISHRGVHLPSDMFAPRRIDC